MSQSVRKDKGDNNRNEVQEPCYNAGSSCEYKPYMTEELFAFHEGWNIKWKWLWVLNYIFCFDVGVTVLVFQELNNLNLLKERVNRSSHLTKGMVGILSSFEHRLARLEETILPVYNETGNLQRRKESILSIRSNSVYSRRNEGICGCGTICLVAVVLIFHYNTGSWISKHRRFFLLSVVYRMHCCPRVSCNSNILHLALKVLVLNLIMLLHTLRCWIFTIELFHVNYGIIPWSRP